MKASLLLLVALSVALLLHASRQTHASELSQLLDKEIQDLKDEIEKRGGKRKPCGFTWFCKRRRSRRSHGKRVSEINIYLFLRTLIPYQTHKWGEYQHLSGMNSLRLSHSKLQWISKSCISLRLALQSKVDWMKTEFRGYKLQWEKAACFTSCTDYYLAWALFASHLQKYSLKSNETYLMCKASERLYFRENNVVIVTSHHALMTSSLKMSPILDCKYPKIQDGSWSEMMPSFLRQVMSSFYIIDLQGNILDVL